MAVLLDILIDNDENVEVAVFISQAEAWGTVNTVTNNTLGSDTILARHAEDVSLLKKFVPGYWSA